MLLETHQSPWSLALPMGAMTFFFGLNRPPTNNLILEQVNRDVGAASSLLVFHFHDSWRPFHGNRIASMG